MANGTTQQRELTERLNFTGWTPVHREALEAVKDVVKAALPGAVDRFYGRLEAWPKLTAMFADASRKKYARDAQIVHWGRLFAGLFDDEYLDSVRRIGQTHSRIGLEPRWFLGAYSQTLSDLFTACVPVVPSKSLVALMQALTLAAHFDMDMVIAVYLEENQIQHRKDLDHLSETFRTAVGQSIGQASSDLQSAAQQIRSSAVETVTRSYDVNKAAQSANLSVQSMAAAMEELSRSISEIRGQTDRSAKMTESAVALTRGIDKIMAGLLAAVSRIDGSLEQINDIAARTNILAINASIEAARAGNVGRGFAVVASEVRNLASQTVGATDTIGGEITSLKKAAQGSAGAVQDIVRVIQEIDSYTSTIAQAVEEQGVVTREIAQSAQSAADGSVVVVENIAVVSSSATETGKIAEGLEAVLSHLEEDLRRLNDRVDEFLAQLK